jgi:hypothetical protein
MTAFAKRLEKLEELLKARSDTGPVYCSRREDETEADALERLDVDPDRVVWVVRTYVDPPERSEEPILGEITATPPISGHCGRTETAERRELEYRPIMKGV